LSEDGLPIGKNGVDPLTATSNEAGQVLFGRLNRQCREFPHEAVVNAAGNVLLNVIRQRNPSREKAEKDVDEMFGRLKAILMAHYDGTNGSRKNVFPFHQNIDVPFMSFRGK
jgi:hypothetical protein